MNSDLSRKGPVKKGPVKGAPRTPITLDRIVRIAFEIIRKEGYEALTMRKVASALKTGPASLYAHVRNKADLDDELIGRLCARVETPEPEASAWKEQVLFICRQLLEQYIANPGIALAALNEAPRNTEALRISEGLLAVLITGGIEPQRAAWFSDAALLYLSAYGYEASKRERHEAKTEHALAVGEEPEHIRRLKELPAAQFPFTLEYLDSVTTGQGHERFEFTLNLMMAGLTA